MRKLGKFAALAVMLICGALTSNAQYYQLASQATSMLQTALQGGMNYRGTIDASYINGLGSKKADFFEISTTQGFKYNEWFFMGLGAGIDFFHTTTNDNPYKPASQEFTQNAAMVPLYSDFRFNFGNQNATNAYFDVRIGAAFYISGDYILVGDGYINTSESFYLRPTLGVRIPVSKSNPKYAVNIGVSYQLLTNTYWYSPGQRNNITLNGLGLTAGFEW